NEASEHPSAEERIELVQPVEQARKPAGEHTDEVAAPASTKHEVSRREQEVVFFRTGPYGYRAMSIPILDEPTHDQEGTGIPTVETLERQADERIYTEANRNVTSLLREYEIEPGSDIFEAVKLLARADEYERLRTKYASDNSIAIPPEEKRRI